MGAFEDYARFSMTEGCDNIVKSLCGMDSLIIPVRYWTHNYDYEWTKSGEQFTTTRSPDDMVRSEYGPVVRPEDFRLIQEWVELHGTNVSR